MIGIYLLLLIESGAKITLTMKIRWFVLLILIAEQDDDKSTKTNT